MLSLNEMVLGYVMLYANPIYLFMGILYLFDVKCHIVHDKDLVISMIKKMAPHIFVPCSKHVNGKDIPIGYFISKRYSGYIDYTAHEYKLYLITSSSIYKELIQSNMMIHISPLQSEPKEIDPDAKIRMCIRKGTYKNFYYSTFKMDMSHITPLGDQEKVVKDIVSIYEKNKRATVFIHGNTSTGKSSIGYLLAKELKGIYCHTFNPSDPGDQLSSLIVDIERDDEPIIIVLEEVDVLLKAIHSENIKKHQDIPMEVYNKSTWSTFLDDMIFYKEVILVMTSNTPKEDIDTIDTAYLREGRIHASYTMNQLIRPL